MVWLDRLIARANSEVWIWSRPAAILASDGGIRIDFDFCMFILKDSALQGLIRGEAHRGGIYSFSRSKSIVPGARQYFFSLVRY